MNNLVKNINPNGMDVWSTTDPEEIRRVIEQLLRGGSYQPNSNWYYRSDRDFLNPYGDTYYPGLNYNSRTGQLWFLSGGRASDSYVSQLTRISKGMFGGNSYAGQRGDLATVSFIAGAASLGYDSWQITRRITRKAKEKIKTMQVSDYQTESGILFFARVAEKSEEKQTNSVQIVGLFSFQKSLTI